MQKTSMNNSDTDICYSRLSCSHQEELCYRDATEMSSPNPDVFEHSWELDSQQRHNQEESKVNGAYHVYQSLRHVGFEALQR